MALLFGSSSFLSSEGGHETRQGTGSEELLGPCPTGTGFKVVTSCGDPPVPL